MGHSAQTDEEAFMAGLGQVDAASIPVLTGLGCKPHQVEIGNIVSLATG